MTSMDDFEKNLKDVVQAKRLSASKMNALTETTMKLMEHDTQLVSILYRTHKSLAPSSKVSSLYVIDAICRAAKHRANKHNLTTDSHSGKSNSATFLSKFEAVLDGVFQDMLQNGGPEAKEKSKKIVDIWTKGSTFPSQVLNRLSDRIKDPDKEQNSKPSDPRVAIQSATPSSQPSAAAPTPTPTPMLSDAQSTLLALLAQAASAGSPPNGNGSVNPQNALLQQLQATQANIPALPQGIAAPAPQANFGQAFQGNSAGPSGPQRPSSRDYNNNYRGSDHQNKGQDREQYQDDYGSSRGGFRGGFRGRGRGRGGDPRGRWDDRDRHREDSLRDRRSSRSRSPRRRDSRDIRPFSPQNRPNMASPPPAITTTSADPRRKQATTETDEFGREVRVMSPTSSHAPSHSPPANTPVDPRTGSLPLGKSNGVNVASSVAAPNPNSVAEVNGSNIASSSSNNSSSQDVSAATSAGGGTKGLESFDVSTFDPTAPASWEALGSLWKVTNGMAPTTEQLMQFLMMIQSGMTPAQIVMQAQATWAQWGGDGNWQLGGDGDYSGGGGGGYGVNGGGGGSWQGLNQQSGAVVVGGAAAGTEVQAGEASLSGDQTVSSSGGGNGGSMQRVGDKWVFVRS